MSSLLKRLWNDDQGAIITIELLFLYVMFILGLIAGWTNLRAAINTELTETAQSLLALSQAYSFTGAVGCNVLNFNQGSIATDIPGTLSWTQAANGTASALANAGGDCP